MSAPRGLGYPRPPPDHRRRPDLALRRRSRRSAAALVWAGILRRWPAVARRSDCRGSLRPRGPCLRDRGVGRPRPLPPAGAHALAERDRDRPRAFLSRHRWGSCSRSSSGATLALAINRRQRSLKLTFNVAQLVLTTGLAVNVFQLVLGSASLESYRAWVAAMLAISTSAIAACCSSRRDRDRRARVVDARRAPDLDVLDRRDARRRAASRSSRSS